MSGRVRLVGRGEATADSWRVWQAAGGAPACLPAWVGGASVRLPSFCGQKRVVAPSRTERVARSMACGAPCAHVPGYDAVHGRCVRCTLLNRYAIATPPGDMRGSMAGRLVCCSSHEPATQATTSVVQAATTCTTTHTRRLCARKAWNHACIAASSTSRTWLLHRLHACAAYLAYLNPKPYGIAYILSGRRIMPTYTAAGAQRTMHASSAACQQGKRKRKQSAGQQGIHVVHHSGQDACLQSVV